jgi:hypothetical protein
MVERFLDEYLAAAPASLPMPKGCCDVPGGAGHCTAGPWISRASAACAGWASPAKAGNHSLRAAGITSYLKNGSKLELARQMATHASACITSLYERCGDVILARRNRAPFRLSRK